MSFPGQEASRKDFFIALLSLRLFPSSPFPCQVLAARVVQDEAHEKILPVAAGDTREEMRAAGHRVLRRMLKEEEG